MDHDDIRIRLLGPVVVRRAGGDHVLGPGRRAAVLTVLALNGNASVERIVSAVWGDDPPASANGNVYTHVNALRTVLGEGVVVRADGAYRLTLDEQAIDLRRFEALRELAQQHRSAGDRHAELATLRDAVDLWAGEALAGVPGPFAGAWRVRLRELRLAAEHRLAEVLLAVGHHSAAVAALRPLVAAHPRDEPASPRTRDVLRAVAFLGDGATLDEVGQVTGLPRAAVDHEVATAMADGVLTTASGVVAFTDPAVARSLYDGTWQALRTTMHGFFAEMIADAHGPPERVAAQLLRTDPAPLSPKASRWLLDHVGELARRSPADTITLLQRAHLQHLSNQETHVALSVWLARLLYGHNRDAVPEAGWVAARTDDLDVQAEMLWIAACSHDRQGRPVAAADIARSVLGVRRHAQPWLDRFRNLTLRLRLRLPGQPTEPRQGRDAVAGDTTMSAYRRSVAADGAG